MEFFFFFLMEQRLGESIIEEVIKGKMFDSGEGNWGNEYM